MAFIFDTSKGETPESIKRKRDLVRALMGAQRTPQNVGEGLSALGDGIVANILASRADKAEKAGLAGADADWSTLNPSTEFPPAPDSPVAAPVGPDPASPAGGARAASEIQQSAPENWEQIRNGIFAGESGGDYDALFGFSNRAGKQFANTRLTDMTVDQALAFANPSGPYAQFVKGQVGRVATPMGAYQVEGRENLTVEQNAVLDAVIAAHDPGKVPAPTRVSRRQFKMQLAVAGLSSAVEAWVAQQDPLVQIAFAESGEFDRTEPMMQTGFASMGFTAEQIEAFFTAASLL